MITHPKPNELPLCGRSWGTEATGWTFCTLQRGHGGNCHNWAVGDKPEAALFFDQQPEDAASIEQQRICQAKADAARHS